MVVAAAPLAVATRSAAAPAAALLHGCCGLLRVPLGPVATATPAAATLGGCGVGRAVVITRQRPLGRCFHFRRPKLSPHPVHLNIKLIL